MTVMDVPGRTPPRSQLFWRLFPMVWLLYLYFPVQSFVSAGRPVWQLLLGGGALAVFLLVWFKVYVERRRLAPPGWLAFGYGWCVLLYVVCLRIGEGNGLTFLVYAAALLGFQRWLGLTVAGVVGVLAALLLPAAVGAEPYEAPVVWQFLMLSAVAGLGNHASYRHIVATIRLAAVQRDKERLAADAERERIARDLHDLLGHTLSVIVLKSELASRLAERDPRRAQQEIREVEQISREALSEVRAAVQGYRGSGLSAELARSKVALDAAGVRLDLETELEALPPPAEYVAEMVLREAITNVVRHARAGTCRVRLTQQGRTLLLEVQDDGRGGTLREGTGLTSMRERVRALGGQLEVGAGDDGRGTRVRVRVPLTPPELSGAAQVVPA
ncbi:sensor histidine kinase [Deinococcus sonorensis]|uniref:Sensor histidine kinase n=2 Tax=Deinococcus sonorensis TaxID=309891 RepID=A0AAU7U9M6_9DEIO